MPEYEVGDRVTIVGGYDEKKVGYSGEVTKVDYCPDHGTETTFYEVKMDPDAPGPSAFVEDLTEEELEHETKEPKYRERQRVRILNPDHAHYGKTGVITLWDRHCSDNSVWYEIRLDEPVGSLHYVQYLDEADIEVYGLQPVSGASFKVDDRIVVLDNDVAPYHRDSGRHGVYEGDTLIADRGWIRLDGDKESKVFRFEFLKPEANLTSKTISWTAEAETTKEPFVTKQWIDYLNSIQHPFAEINWKTEAETWHGDDANAHKEFGTMVCDESDRYWVSFGDDLWLEAGSAYVESPRRLTAELGNVTVISVPVNNGANK